MAYWLLTGDGEQLGKFETEAIAWSRGDVIPRQDDCPLRVVEVRTSSSGDDGVLVVEIIKSDGPVVSRQAA